jgi:hypothetical protein
MFDRLFGRRWLVIAVYAIALPVAGWLCSRITLDSNLLNLLPGDIPAVKTVRKLESWSGTLQFMYLGLVRDDRTSLSDLKRFADEVGAELERSPWVKAPISVGVDVTAIRKAAPLFLDPDDLATVGTRLDAAVKARRKQQSASSSISKTRSRRVSTSTTSCPSTSAVFSGRAVGRARPGRRPPCSRACARGPTRTGRCSITCRPTRRC